MEQSSKQTRVLVTGASGYLAGHVVYYLLERDYLVRGTVRSLKDPKKISHLYEIYPSKKDNLELVEADLLDKSGWDAAMKDVDYVLHLASPFPFKIPKNEQELIKPAVEGTQTVFEAALRNGIKKIVITSSIASVFTGVKAKNSFTEADWSNLAQSPAYEKSKHLAEKKAWEIYEANKDKIQMTVMLPGFIQGPSFHANGFSSGDFVLKIMKDEMPGIPKISLGIVDVRDVALAHVLALDQSKMAISNGKRYLLVEGSYWLEDILGVFKEEFSKYGYKFPSFTVTTSFVLAIAGLFDSQVDLIKPFFKRFICFDNSLSRNELGIQYRYHNTTLIEFAYDLIKKGLIPNKLANKKK